jgi:putative phosphoesterase
MSAKIGLISDIHATAAPLREALTIFEQERVDLILCLGDIAGYGTELEPSIELLIESGCITIQGNHDVWHLERQKGKQKEWLDTFLHRLPVTWQSTVAGKSIFAVHASPPTSMTRGITLLDQNEKILAKQKEQWNLELAGYAFDVLVVGHTHQVFAELLGQTLLINPGSTTFNNSCAILSLPDLKIRIIPLLGKTIRKIWHWGMKT